LDPESPTRILIADDHPLFRGALREALAGVAVNLSVSEAGSLEEVVRHLDREPETDLVLLDLAMPGVRGYSGLMFLRAQFPSIPVVIVSANAEPSVARHCLDFGAAGFVPKTLDLDNMRSAIRRVLQGGIFAPVGTPAMQAGGADPMVARLATLTPQQVRVLMMLSEGLLNKQIAYELSVSEATVKAHVSAILTKLGVESRTQAVIAAAKIESGIWGGSELS
jgi:DNA-binding NarL/FixJ family response regulator